MNNSRDISNSTTVEAHFYNLLFDTSLSSWMTVVEDEGAAKTFRIITGVALFAFGRLAMFRDISRYPFRGVKQQARSGQKN